ncbi:hypothetical protein CMU73_10360 [Elizabethkingia anophelis]|nr:hypothetical protein [Elizabethkingia anophelis]MDV3571038.1 hypothetical protein [Elizabethkingia anophelis]MDV3588561.1 hypothetical protein [Elizabethkingia anophelis]MDV3717375.1 hypothetical protein [Elizabethkingia anophelis]MDV3818844.1 hypothetical protein [Elizabethkingia anophelis]
MKQEFNPSLFRLKFLSANISKRKRRKNRKKKKKRKPFENERGILSRFLGKSFCVDFYTQKLFLKIRRA